MPDEREFPVVVSLQVMATGSPSERHRSVGLLVEPGVVLVPEMHQDLVEQDFEVLVIPVPLSPDRLIERHRPTRIEILQMPDAPPIAEVELGTHSRYQSGVNWFDGCDFRNRLTENGGQLWQTLEDLHVVTSETRNGPDSAVLDAVPDIELYQRAPDRRTIVVSSPGVIADWVCWFTPRCEPCGPYGS